MPRSNRQASVLLDNVYALIRKNVDERKSALVEEFAQILFSNISSDDLLNRSDSELYGSTLSLWNSLNEFDKETLVRVINPEVTKHGWESSHTIIKLIVSDMPFLVDSVRMALNRLGITAHLFLNSPVKLERNKDGSVKQFIEPDKFDAKKHESQTAFFIEVDRQALDSDINELTQELHDVLAEVSHVVADWKPMRNKLVELTDSLSKKPYPGTKEQLSETLEFLKWLGDHNFTLMGYRSYNNKAVSGDHILIPDSSTSLGLMKTRKGRDERRLSDLPASARDIALSDNLLVLTKTQSKSRVHRPAYIDYVGIKRFDEKGNVVGEDRFVGLYAANFYNASLNDIPLLKRKTQLIMEGAKFEKGTHSYKGMMNILETYPRDEMLQASVGEMRQTALGVLRMQERGISRLFVRRDAFGRFFSCMVYTPRERYNTQLRRDTQRLFQASFGTEEEVEFTTFFSESVYARTHYIVRVKNNNLDINVKEIENNLIEAAKSWEDKLNAALLSTFGESKGKILSHKYSTAFMRSYMEHTLASGAMLDIQKLEELKADKTLEMLFYKPQEVRDTQEVRLKLYHKDQPIHLSDVLPILENFGLRVIDESPYKVASSDEQIKWIMDFSMLQNSGTGVTFEESQTLFQDAFDKVWHRKLEDDGFNRLVLGAGLTGRQVTILRAYAKYMRQIGSTFSQSYIEDTLSHYPHLARQVFDLFDCKFNPGVKQSKKKIEAITGSIESDLDNVANLDDDRIIRRFVEMIMATFRTNFYQNDEEGQEKVYVSFKIQPEFISDMPLPLPKFEIFVYSPRVEGVHLRGGKVARGGLRWSDRREDFRTEVLGLVKAQNVKNTVIVPVGAKGGFVCKQLPTSGGRDAFFAEGTACYQTFIRGLLDITDNIVQGDIVYPENVVRHDEDDPYLVVAADKGTATFSDIANAISQEYNFWMGDAFASGGSVGYDHKKMGITARGAWESVKRHFREIDIDCQNQEFTCVGVGDMGGDVFGNGMLLSKKTKLVAAFNHMHIFFDPAPDAAKSYKERERMFALPVSTWEDYNAKLISKGGGIFSRSSKSIELTPEMKKWLGTSKSAMPPNELINNILKMPVDLLWNGGIGTYIKSKKESHAEVGDRANDAVRVNGGEVKAKIIGEGGNLGCTQLGRIEYCQAGGRMNTDSVDNVGGVDCSDNEVNIKILLNGLVDAGDLTVKQRNNLLYDMTDDVSRIVLEDCYRQTQAISVTQTKGASQLKEQIRFIHDLERAGKLDRDLEFLPSDEELADRQADGKGFTRPELSVLFAYGKMVLKDIFNVPEVTANDYHKKLLPNAFPEVLREKFGKAMENHPLRGEIIATKLANNMVNDMGFNIVLRLQEETGASPSEIANAYAIATAVYDVEKLRDQLEALDNEVPSDVQSSAFFEIRRTIRRATRWFLRHGNKQWSIRENIQFFKPVFADLNKNLFKYLIEDEVEDLKKAIEKLKEKGLSASLAYDISTLSTRFSAFDLAQVANGEQRDISLVAALYFEMGAKLDLHWFLAQIINQPVANHWQALARASYREEMDWQQRALTAGILRSDKKTKHASKILEQWFEDNQILLARWQHMLAEFRTSKSHEFAKFSVALRELMLLSHNCDTE